MNSWCTIKVEWSRHCIISTRHSPECGERRYRIPGVNVGDSDNLHRIPLVNSAPQPHLSRTMTDSLAHLTAALADLYTIERVIGRGGDASKRSTTKLIVRCRGVTDHTRSMVESTAVLLLSIRKTLDLLPLLRGGWTGNLGSRFRDHPPAHPNATRVQRCTLVQRAARVARRSVDVNERTPGF